MTRDTLLRALSTAEFAEWVALYRLEAREREKAEKDAKHKGKRGRR